MRKIFAFLLLLAFCAGAGKGVYWARKGFNIRKVREPVHARLEFWNEEADLALAQKYRFLGRGRQCFAFESEDGKYVVKLPRTDIYQIPAWLRFSPFENLKKQYAKQRGEQERFILQSFRIAYEELHEQTGTLALHIGHTGSKTGKRISLIDRLGCSFHLPVETTTFVLQTKHPILMKAFLAAREKGERHEAERILSAFIDIVVDRGKRGIWNRDESFLRNYGFDGEKAFQIDIGSFYHKEDGLASIKDTMHPVRTWLVKTDPSFLPFFDNTLQSKLQ